MSVSSMRPSEAVRIATRRLLPLLAICYFINIIDRTNISIAALKMNPDIGLSAASYGLGAGIFFVGYFFLELPSNMLLNRFGARRWIFRIMITWGIVSLMMAFVWNDTSFYVVRFLLGCAEAGFFPGVIYYFSQWFDRRSLTRIVGLFYGVIPIASAIAAPVSTALLVGVGWRWLFVLEGGPAIILSFLVLRFLPERIDRAPWLTSEQKTELLAGLEPGAGSSDNKGAVKAAFKDRQTILLAVQYFLITLGTFAISLWLPQVIAGMGFSTAGSGLLSAVPFVFAAILVPLWAIHSSRTNERFWHAMIPILAAAVVFTAGGFITGSPITSVIMISFGVAFSLMAASAYWSIPRVLAVGGAAAASLAIANSFGNLAGFVGPFITGLLEQATGSFSLVLSLLGIPLLLAAILSAFSGRMGERKQARDAALAAEASFVEGPAAAHATPEGAAATTTSAPTVNATTTISPERLHHS